MQEHMNTREWWLRAALSLVLIGVTCFAILHFSPLIAAEVHNDGEIWSASGYTSDDYLELSTLNTTNRPIEVTLAVLTRSSGNGTASASTLQLVDRMTLATRTVSGFWLGSNDALGAALAHAEQ